MNLEQMRKTNLNESSDLKYFIQNNVYAINNAGPVTTIIPFIEMLHSDDESLSIQVWIHILDKIGSYFYETKTFVDIPRIKAYINMLKEVLSDEVNTIPHMKSIKKWSQLVMPSISESHRVKIYSIDQIMKNELESTIGYASMDYSLNLESLKVKTAVKGYLAFVKTLMK